MSQPTVKPASLAELAQFAMLLEVTARGKPGNIDRCHDYEDTRLDHFLSSAVLAKPVFSAVEEGRLSIGEAMRDAVARTNMHNGGNTHFGAFLLLLPLIAGRGIAGAAELVKKTTVTDAVLFYEAFGLTQVRVRTEDPMDVNDPASVQRLIDEQITMYNVMEYSAPHDMVAREWTNGFALTRRAADLLIAQNSGVHTIPAMFLALMAEYPDTFIAKKFDAKTAEAVMYQAREVLDGKRSLAAFDGECIKAGINPGSLADICIAGIFTALLEGWKWDC
ncbi:MAG: triphosphoribosyl-dephospho-CoA synthase [Methanocorpusculum sp.]|uniref:Triphosphoribosyl-dephospho-CoA synthase n=1 Tax=Methanocorpusculum petauri TaxID=3002863 RepID=A0ABT4IFR7_9EURY|nr:triphosphoribosyl-dephospho-CoA synthase [Methanocorpusculum petauri]MDE2443051.1 triphosphoribosyl-dephospho-CoA synthase [Methanocorpusculum sp.]MCZ0860040.1 triphosphoribosyl-dephospho-CoA synthase [Methanocorpusculum petauri]MDE2518909.1 triphosphoribosyl-dephospho-CoA synthase [Methanocorpusculum sp.]MDE2521947.1 triphosphoribosyl-dephospho-CoA synthase [Methanocorpusculum sp.]MDE2525489.1 triphosphoribosyl-dephospho-CoA synthase [Methanocorpusculum sp.]